MSDAGEPLGLLCWASPHRGLSGEDGKDCAAAGRGGVCSLSLDVAFAAYREELKRVEAFKYLGRLLVFDNNDMRVVLGNLLKA